ncbi:MAG: hypothetical protein E7614_03870 [Ruminococcaceae bacterium]|nr:hypothetical protein [Oscillospiraceae bacterium]
MKKIISILICSALLFSLSFSSVSAEETTCEETHIEFIFEEGLSSELKTKIEAHLLGESTNPNARGFWCNLFGHDLVESTTTQVTHKVNASAPRCLKEIYEVEACEDCDYVKSTLIAQSYINCCT